jgi:hypothetical protein
MSEPLSEPFGCRGQTVQTTGQTQRTISMAMQNKQSFARRWEDYQPSKTTLVMACAATAIVTVIVGFSWGGWVTGGTSQSQAKTGWPRLFAAGRMAKSGCRSTNISRRPSADYAQEATGSERYARARRRSRLSAVPFGELAAQRFGMSEADLQQSPRHHACRPLPTAQLTTKVLHSATDQAGFGS